MVGSTLFGILARIPSEKNLFHCLGMTPSSDHLFGIVGLTWIPMGEIL
jgi:hypothetical protein